MIVLRPLYTHSDKTDDELEMTTVCHRPEGLEQLEAQTNFTKRELQILYRGFKNVSPLYHGRCHCAEKMPNVKSLCPAGMSQWRSQRGNIQTHLCTVLSSRR